ncbi:GNAT family N-acetyltransferase [Aquihabitans sp. McL0605]|uniref:GNAT family N-acetyltransferase n=1 Tax=Aquihabitans sp. McL0605 TaxID=3415671 RepID=UPI003CF527AE
MVDQELRATSSAAAAADTIPASERAFYVTEFSGATIVASMAAPSPETVASVERAARSLAAGAARLVLVVGRDQPDPALAAAFPAPPVVLAAPAGRLAPAWLAELWLAITDRQEVLVTTVPGQEAGVGARLAVALQALKLVLTDAQGGWGRPPRSFADIATHADAFEHQLADRQGGAVVAALDEALAGGVTNVNLCRPEDIDRELFTFDGAGTLFTSGAYLALGSLRVDDLPAVERLVAQGTADGLLRPRTRLEVAQLGVSGIGARVVGSGHLAGIVGLETEAYRAEGVGEVSGLYTVSRFSGSGAGGLLIDALMDRASELGLASVFAITVSDLAASFFVRKGFAEVAHDAIPSVKWAGYDAERLARARAFVRDAAPAGDQGSFGF